MRVAIKLKLGLAFGLMILLMIGAIGYGLSSLGHLNEATTQLVGGPVAIAIVAALWLALFAVVASEVRKLAERSQVAATEIGAVSTETVKAARTAGEMLAGLVPNIRRTAELVTEISAACREQDIGASQINEAIQQLDQVTQQNASAAEEMTATSDTLSSQAEELQASIAYFRIDGSNTGHPQAPGPKPKSKPVPVARPVARPPHRSAAPKPPLRRPIGPKDKPAAASGRGNGVALDLTKGGPDNEDVHFKAYS